MPAADVAATGSVRLYSWKCRCWRPDTSIARTNANSGRNAINRDDTKDGCLEQVEWAARENNRSGQHDCDHSSTVLSAPGGRGLRQAV